MKSSLAIQLYSLRRETKVDAAGTIRRVPSLGYDGVETAGTYDMTADQWIALLAETKLSVVGAHVGLQALETDWDRHTSFYRSINCPRLIVPSLPKELQTQAGFAEAAVRLNKLADKARAAGFSFHYHNHAFEFAKFDDGTCGMDILLRNTDPSLLTFEVDTYWVERGGLNSRLFMEKNATRIGLIHAKELRKSDGADVAAGKGDVDFRAIIPMARNQKWPVVVEYEGENAEATVAESARYLSNIG